jgi:rubrerythrin
MKIKESDLSSKFRCAKCGYLTQRQAPPRSCPMCRAGSEVFDDIGVDRSTLKKAVYNPKLI